ncbi:SH3YL1 family protein [Abortiporus biennis]
MKLNSPIPQTLPKECLKAAKIFKSFVDSGNNGLDGVIPRHVLENAKGFAIFTVFKAGFLFSARAGSGVVVARLDDGMWSAPSAIGTAGLGVGGQAGAEMTDFLVVLNSRAAVRSFMAAGSLTLGGNLSIAVGPLGRNGEALGSVNSSGKLAAMYSYSKTRGLFGGVSVEGSVIVERQDANAQAYHSDVTAKMLLSGSITPPDWAMPLIHTLESCTGPPGNHRWVQEHNFQNTGDGYMFDNVASPGYEDPYKQHRLKKKDKEQRPGFFSRKSSNSYFDSRDTDTNPYYDTSRSRQSQSQRDSLEEPWQRGELTQNDKPTTEFFETQFESDFVSDEEMRKHPRLKPSPESKPQKLVDDSDWRSVSAYTPMTYTRRSFKNPFATASPPPADYDSHNRSASVDYLEDLEGRPPPQRRTPTPKIFPKVELTKPLTPQEGIARAIALFDFNAVQPGDLSFSKGDVIIVKEMSNNTDTWWSGKVGSREGIFPANFVEVV